MSTKTLVFSALLLACTSTSFAADPDRGDYPAHWWEPVPREDAPSWEVLPQDAGPGEVILSKRNELGRLSNFAATAFTLDGTHYPSLEGFWQMMKYPETADDPRATHPGVSWPHTRPEVAAMVGFEAKRAGDAGSENMRKMGINWVSYRGERMTYRTPRKGAHYDLIVRAMRAKIAQNPPVREILLSTGDLVLRPDHRQGENPPPAWQYHRIYMRIRSELQD